MAIVPFQLFAYNSRRHVQCMESHACMLNLPLQSDAFVNELLTINKQLQFLLATACYPRDNSMLGTKSIGNWSIAVPLNFELGRFKGRKYHREDAAFIK